MKLYRFSPINNEKSLWEAIDYIAKESLRLSKKIINITFPISYITVFSHYEEEYLGLLKIWNNLWISSETNNWVKISLFKEIDLYNSIIKNIRIRKPDPYRTQVWCNDFKIADYYNFKNNYLGNKNLRLIIRDNYEMIEFFHPDFDVLSYVVSIDFSK